MNKNDSKYNDMPLKYIQDLPALCFQIAKRNAKQCLEALREDCDTYGIDLYCCLSDFKQELAKQYKNYEGD